MPRQCRCSRGAGGANPVAGGGRARWPAPWLVLVLVTAACLPAWKSYRALPAVQGRLTRDGEPLRGVEIRAGRGRHGCAHPARVTTTDSSGAFALAEQRITRFPLWLIPVPFERSWQVCAAGDSLVTLWREPEEYVPDSLALNCEGGGTPGVRCEAALSPARPASRPRD